MSAHTRYRATFVHPGVMNRSLLAHAVHPVWVTIRVHGGDTVCMEWCSGSAVPEEPPDLSAWRRGRTRRKNRNDTHEWCFEKDPPGNK